jgi:hypothetical protein
VVEYHGPIGQTSRVQVSEDGVRHPDPAWPGPTRHGLARPGPARHGTVGR